MKITERITNLNPMTRSPNGSTDIKNFTGWLAVELAVFFLWARFGVSALLYIRQWVYFQPFFPTLCWLVFILMLFIVKRLFLKQMPVCFRSARVYYVILGISLIVIVWSALSIRPFFNGQFWNIEISKNAIRMLARYETKFKNKTGAYTENLDELGRALFNNPSYVNDRLESARVQSLTIKVSDGDVRIRAIPAGFQFLADPIVYDSSEPRLLDMPPGFAVTWSFDPGMNSDKLSESWSYKIRLYGNIYDFELGAVHIAMKSYKMQFPSLFNDADELIQGEAFRVLPPDIAWFLVHLNEKFKGLKSRKVPSEISAKKVWELYQVVEKNRFTALPKNIAPKRFSTFGQEAICINVRMAGEVYESRLYVGDKMLSNSKAKRFLKVHEWLKNNLTNN